jgi:hypothetical protein
MPTSDNNITHMADAVTAAMAASRKRDRENSIVLSSFYFIFVFILRTR